MTVETPQPDLKAIAREYFKRVDDGSPQLLDLFTEDAQMYFPKFGVGRGRAAILSVLTGLGSVFASVKHDSSTYLYIRSGNRLAVEGTSRGVLKSGEHWAAGETPAGRFCNIFEFRGELISRLHIYLDPDYAGQDGGRFLWGRDGRSW
jgi:hypothetical protein